MTWVVLEHPEFAKERARLDREVSRKLDQLVVLTLQDKGPALGRPFVDTLKGSRHRKTKEPGFFESDGVWRFAFAFDPDRRAIILVGGDLGRGPPAG